MVPQAADFTGRKLVILRNEDVGVYVLSETLQESRGSILKIMLKRWLVLAMASVLSLAAAESGSPTFTPADLFQMNKIWNIHISLTSDQYAAMQPTRSREGIKLPGSSWLQGSEGKRNGWASTMGIEFQYVKGAVDFEGIHLVNVGVRYKGNGTFVDSQGSEKLPLKLHLNEYVKGQKFAGLTTLNLHNQVTDPGYMNEVIAYWMFRNAKAPAPRTAYAKVSMSVSGKFAKKYLGLYVLTENVDEHFFSERTGDKNGAIFKPVTNDLFLDRGTDWKKYNQAYDPKTKLTPAQQERVFAFARLVTKASDAEFRAKVGTFIDLDEFARFLAGLVMVVDMDGILTSGQNYYVYLNSKTNLFQFVTWDHDHSFGGLVRGRLATPTNLSIRHPWEGSNRFLERMLEVPAFEQLYMARLNEFSKSIFLPERFAKQMDLIAPVIRPAIGQESSRKLAEFDSAMSGPSSSPGGSFMGFFQGPVYGIKAFTTARQKSIVDQLAGRAAGELMRGVRR